MKKHYHGTVVKKCIASCWTAVIVMGGCGKKEIPYTDTVDRQCAIAMSELDNNGEAYVEYGVNTFDFDGSGATVILTCTRLEELQHTASEWRVRCYYKDGAWHEGANVLVMRANVWDIYYRVDIRKQPRWFKRDGVESVSAIFFDREKGNVTLEPFDYQEFYDLQKRKIIKPYEDIGQDDVEVYVRIEDDVPLRETTQPRWFNKKSFEDSVEATSMLDWDEKITITEPFDFHKFDDLRQRGLLKRTK